MYTFLLAFANVFIENFLNIDLDGVTKVFSVIILAGLIELLIDQFFKYYSRNSETNIFENIKNMIFPRKKERKKGDPFL